MTGTLGMAIVAFVALAAFLTFGKSLWQHKLSEALTYLGLSLVLLGAILEIVALREFADPRGSVFTRAWGSLPTSAYLLPFVVGFVLMVAGGLVGLLLRLEATARLTKWLEGFVFRHNAVAEPQPYRDRLMRATAAEQSGSGQQQKAVHHNYPFDNSTPPHGS